MQIQSYMKKVKLSYINVPTQFQIVPLIHRSKVWGVVVTFLQLKGFRSYSLLKDVSWLKNMFEKDAGRRKIHDCT